MVLKYMGRRGTHRVSFAAILLAIAWIVAGSSAYAATSPTENFERVRSAIEDAGYDMEPVSIDYCRDDGQWCEGYAETWIQIQAYGNGIVDLLPTTQLRHFLYREMCAETYSGLANVSRGFAEEAMTQAFTTASTSGRFKQEIDNVEIEIYDDSRNIMGCRFFRY